ncbi:MAG: NDP-sugar synthase [Myxococcota bacterium]
MTAGSDLTGVKGALLCAGLGTRLRPLTDERPKPMLPLCNAPLARYGFALLRGAGVRTIGVNLHYLGGLLRAEFAGEVVYSDEPEILGTGGALVRLARAIDLAGDDLIVHNGKVVLELDLADVIARHRASGAVATMVVREAPDARAWGAIDVGDDGRVRGLLGDGRTMFCGVHVLTPEFLRVLPEGVSDSVRDAYIPLVRAGAPVVAYVARGHFSEHSTPERYLAAHLALLGGARVSQATWPLAGIDPSATVDAAAWVVAPSLVGAGARIEAGARVGPLATIGAGAIVAAGATVERAVVWDGAVATGDLRDAIVTRRSVVRL